MNIAQIEKNLADLVSNISKESFIYDLLLAYGVPKATVSLLKKGKRNLSKRDDQIILKKKLFFQEIETQEIENQDIHHTQDIHHIIDTLKNDATTHRHDPRFIVVTDYQTLLAVDTKTNDTLDIKIAAIVKYPFFFGAWAKIEKTSHANENPADVKAAEKMAKIYDEILQYNEFKTKDDLHELNIFLSRLLFCFFAEDTGIFDKNDFTNAINSHTQDDGSDLQEYLNKLFEFLNTKERQSYPLYLHIFPYVNGGLLSTRHNAPIFSGKARKMIIECGKLDWKDINPDIFGSMFQAVVHKDQRSNMGMHYTSVPNIMKVIEPLFLNELKEEFKRHRDNEKKLKQLLTRLGRLRIFDPACGSGNFLVIAYKEIRRLEIKILESIKGFSDNQPPLFSHITLSQFYGIELDDFAHEIAILSLWLKEHQMNMEFKKNFGHTKPTLPLQEGGKIVCENATCIPWEDVCPKDKDAEIYILGNPPYLGSSMQNVAQKEELASACSTFKNYKNLDYIACWFIKGAEYIQGINAKFAFVSTNSICQGEQVGLLWPYIFNKGLEISFAHTSFKWTNSAKRNAGVTCVVVGLRNNANSFKRIFQNNISNNVENITPYLTSGRFISILRRTDNISKLPNMLWGNKTTDGGFLILSPEEKETLLKKHPSAKKFLKKYVGSQEFIRGIDRWCLWIDDTERAEAERIPEINSRINNVSKMRNASRAVSTRAAAARGHRFIQIQHEPNDALIIPGVSSENRKYIPIGFVDKNTVVNSQCYVIYNPEPFLFGVISSLMHMVWVKAVAGQLETRLSYSSALCYCSFPITDLTEKQKQTITTNVYNVLEEREKHSEKTIAQLYDPDKMPDGLREAHDYLDMAIERCYRSKPFTSNEERLEYLFKLYEDMTRKEK